LFEQAKHNNIIACLDTGAGKTLVAVMLLQYFNDVELSTNATPEHQRPERHSRLPQEQAAPRRIGIFLVERVPLVDQQAKVIVANSNLDVSKFSSSDAHQNGSRMTWNSVRRKSDVVVSTAQIVLTALTHGWLSLDDVYLIVFDEVHHAFGNTAYSGIMHFYDDAVKKGTYKTLPRIFSMTASPLKARGTDEARTSERLESIMKSHILTAPVIHRAELAMAVNKPVECIVGYAPPTPMEDSALTKAIREQSRGMDSFLPVLDRIQYHTKQHGPLFADIIWATSINELRKQTATTAALSMINQEWLMEHASRQTTRRGRLTTNAENARLINEAVSQSFHLPDTIDLDPTLASPKVLKLIEVLNCFATNQEAQEGLRGIIFVERRDTAYALHEIVHRQESLHWLKTAWVIGHGEGHDSVGLQQSHSEQESVLNHFRSGDYNLLIATSVIEEGLDVSPCNLIIRFDLFTNHVSFVQSKGRARHKRSRFVIMAENGNEEHFRLIKEVADTDRALREWLTDLPDDRIHDVRFEELKEDPDANLVLEVPQTGAKLYVNQAVKLFAEVHASLVGVDDGSESAKYEYETLPKAEGFRCCLKFPAAWKIPDVVSDVRQSKKAARRQAAFRACELLYKQGKLNSFLRPKEGNAQRRRAGMAALAPTRLDEGIKVKTRQLQSYRGLNRSFDKEAEVWNVHATLIRLDDLPQTVLNGPCRPMIILTADPVDRSGPVTMRFTSQDYEFKGMNSSTPITLSNEKMLLCRRYTMRLLRWIGRKGQWYCEDDNMPYITIPATMNAGKARVFDFAKHVDWDEIERLSQWTTKPVLESGLDVSIGQFWDRILLEKEYEIGAVAYAVTGVTKYKEEYGEAERLRTEKRSTSARSRQIWKDMPTVGDAAYHMDWFTVSRIERMQNWLTGIIEHSQEPKYYHAAALPPSNVWVHAISASAYRSGLVLPSILDRIHQVLCAMRCNAEIFEGKIAAQHLIDALTIPQALYKFNYERLEFIGDTFLKLLGTAYVFAEDIKGQEGHLHNARREIIMNRTLLKHCHRLKLEDFMLLASFGGPRSWVPPNFVNPSGGRATSRKIEGPRGEGYLPCAPLVTPDLPQKALADLVESTMGAGLMTDGLEGAMHAARCLGITARPIYSLGEVTELYRKKVAGDVAAMKLDEAFSVDKLQQLEQFLGYKFISPHIALQAITHASTNVHVTVESYERLEFLGDAVLDYFAVTDVYYRYPDLDQGELTEYKDKLCMNRTLGALAESIGMHRFLNSAAAVLQLSIDDANKMLRERRVEEERKPASQRGVYWADVKVPKQVADIVESLMGAVALDSGFDMAVLQALYNRMFKPFYDQYCRPRKEVDDSVRAWEGFIEQQGCVQWRYVHDYTYQDEQKVYTTAIEAHNVVWTHSSPCKTRRRSQIQACRAMMDPFRDRYHVENFQSRCTCRGKGPARVSWGAGKRKDRA